MSTSGFIKTRKERIMSFFLDKEFNQIEFVKSKINLSFGDQDLDQYPKVRTLTFFELMKIMLRKND
jgi:hypothetical protein